MSPPGAAAGGSTGRKREHQSNVLPTLQGCRKELHERREPSPFQVHVGAPVWTVRGPPRLATTVGAASARPDRGPSLLTLVDASSARWPEQDSAVFTQKSTWLFKQPRYGCQRNECEGQQKAR